MNGLAKGLIAGVLAMAAGLMGGCASGRTAMDVSLSEDLESYRFTLRSLDPELIFAKPEAPRDLRMFAGQSRTRLLWGDVREGLLWSEVVVIMADPTDKTSASVATALVEDSLAEWPWTRLSLQELDRADQSVTSAFVAGSVDEARFLSESGLTGSEAEAYWATARAPMMQAATAYKAKVIAPTVPNDLVTVASSQGVKGLKDLKKPQSQQYALPKTTVLLNDSALESATVADSIADALHETRNPRVIHVMDLNKEKSDAMLAELAARRPGTRVVTVAVLKSSADELRDVDAVLGDVVIYTNEN